MNEHGGVDVCDVHDAGRGNRRDQGLYGSLADEFGASATFWTRAKVSADLGIIVWATGDS
jgi:hypothetical protein